MKDVFKRLITTDAKKLSKSVDPALKQRIQYANIVCHDCGMKYGKGTKGGVSTFHFGLCDICLQNDCPVTEFRDYGYAKGVYLE
jgi:hypothetical protein